MKEQNSPPSFFEARMQLLGVTEHNNKIEVINPAAEHPMPSRFETKIFEEDKHGNIEILYWTLDRELITYVKMGEGKMSHINGKTVHYKVLRYKEPKGDRKYLMPAGKYLKAEGYNATFPWLHPNIISAFKKGEEIDTLFLTEGVFKAWMGCQIGMYIIGLSSITHYAGSDGKLYPDLIRIIERCKVRQVVILWDGDCLDISLKALAIRKDLATRPKGFYASAKKIGQLIKSAAYEERSSPPDVFFYHVRSDENNDAKGLDDLIIAKQDSKAAIVRQAHEFNKRSVYFKKFDITETTAALHEYFGLKNQERFYNMHRTEIGYQEFRFNGDWLRYDDDEEELKLISPGWAENTFWIGDEYYRLVEVPSAHKTTRKELKPYNVTTLTKIFQKDFWKYLEPYTGFCNVPSHFDYQQIVELHGMKFYNRYFPFNHLPEKGKWPHILGFMKHIFGEEEVVHEVTGEKIPRWKLGIDYIQILLLQPTAMLPVIVLFSQENGTGKSTFGRLISAMFGDNVVPIGNSDLQSDFNETYGDKLVAICEETLLERKKDVERIKSLSTNPRILVNPKGMRQFQIDFFCKFMFFSNNPRMIYVTRHDTRFWIMKVPQFKKEIPNFAELMEEEIPAFIFDLKNRKLASEREGRMHFHPSLLRTKTFEETVKINEPAAATDMRSELARLFMLDLDMDRIELPLAEIRTYFFQPKTSTGWIREILRDYLQVSQRKGKDGKPKLTRGHYPLWENNQDGELVRKSIAWRGRPYVFLRGKFAEWVSEADYKEIKAIEAAKRREELKSQGYSDKALRPANDEEE